MSTKIFDAFKFNGKANELLNHVRSYRSKWIDFQIERILSNNNPEEYLVNEHKHKHNSAGHLASHLSLYDFIKDQSTKQFASWGDVFDVRGSVAVYFHKRNIYVQTFLQCTGLPPEFIDDRFVDFHYQNQTDPWYFYENLSIEEKKKAARNWRVRKKVWDDIYSGDFNTASQAGLIYEMCGDSDYHAIARKVLEKFK